MTVREFKEKNKFFRPDCRKTSILIFVPIKSADLDCEWR